MVEDLVQVDQLQLFHQFHPQVVEMEEVVELLVVVEALAVVVEN